MKARDMCLQNNDDFTIFDYFWHLKQPSHKTRKFKHIDI